jgi:DNA-binding transcriptional LysR family regulator
MDNRTQVEALLNGSVMLAIGRLDPNLEESESLTTTFLLRSPFCIACSEHRWPAKRGTPKHSDFREDNFVKILAESVLPCRRDQEKPRADRAREVFGRAPALPDALSRRS